MRKTSSVFTMQDVGSRPPPESAAPTISRRRHGGVALRSVALQRLPTVTASAGLLVTGMMTSVVISRALGPVGRGGYVAWQAWAASASIFAIGGLPQALVLDSKTIGRHRLGDLLLLLLSASALASIPLGILIALRRPGGVTALAVLSIAVANQAAGIAIAEAQGTGRMAKEFNLARLMPQFAVVAAIAALLMIGSESAATWLITIGGLQATTMLVWLSRTAASGRTTAAAVRGLMRTSVLLAPASWVTLLQYRADMLAVALIFPPRAVAFYSVGMAAQTVVVAAGQISGMHWFARQGDDFESRHLYLHSEVLRTVLTAGIVAVPVVLTSGIWVHLLYGDAFAPSVPLVVLLSLVGVLQSVDYLLVHECLMSGQGARVALYRVAALSVVPAGLALVKLLGWPSAAVALLSGLGFVLSIPVFLIARRHHGRVPLRPAGGVTEPAIVDSSMASESALPAMAVVSRPANRSTSIIVHYGDTGPTVLLANRVAGYSTDVVIVANDLSRRPEALNPAVEWIVPQRNLGYGEAFMFGASGRTTPALVLLNNDIVLTSETFEICLDTLLGAQDIGVVGPVLRHPDGSLQSGAGRFSRVRRAPRFLIDPGPRTAECTWVTGAVMFIRREVAETVGMDGSFFLGAEDVDLCVRAGRAGWRVLCCGQAPAIHHQSQVIAGPRWSYYYARNMVWLSRTEFGLAPAIFAWLYLVRRIPRVVVGDIVKRRNFMTSRLYTMGVLHAWRHKPSRQEGPMPSEPVPARVMKTW